LTTEPPPVTVPPEPPPPLPLGSKAGGSAQAEYDKRVAAREEAIRTRHPRTGGFRLRVTEEPQTTTAWKTGATGERRLGVRLDGLAGEDTVVLHDRRRPRTRANIDHLVVCPNGVWVIDAKLYADKKVERRDVGGLFRKDLRLYVGRQDQTKLIEGVQKQAEDVRAALGDRYPSAPIRPTLCFLDSPRGLSNKPFDFDGVTVIWPKALTKRILEPGDLDAAQVNQIARLLAQRLPPA
jgi:hypothetical protein